MWALLLNLLKKLLLVSLMSMSSRTILISRIYDVSLSTLHLNWVWKSNCSSTWSALALTYLNSAEFTRVFSHLMTKTRPSVRVTILIWHVSLLRPNVLIAFVIVLTSMTLWPSLNKMSSSRLWSWSCASTVAIFTKVVQPLRLLLLHHLLIVLWIWIVPFASIQGWNKARRSMRTHSRMVNYASSLVVDLNYSRFILFFESILILVVIRLLHFITPFLIRYLLHSRCSTSWSAHGVAFFIACALAVVSFFLDDKLILSISLLLLKLHRNLIILICKLRMVVKSSKLFLTLIRS